MVQPKYSPEEALEKMKLMMKYDSSKTLNENKEIIFEQEDSCTNPISYDELLEYVNQAEEAIDDVFNWAGSKDLTDSSEDAKDVYDAIKAVVGKNIYDEESGKCVPAIQMFKTRYKEINSEDWVGGKESLEDGLNDLLKRNFGAESNRYARLSLKMLNAAAVVPDGKTQAETGGKKNEKAKTNNGGGGGTGYKPCSGTYSFGCKSAVIDKVQGCLNADTTLNLSPKLVPDGKFGPKTKAALTAKGFSSFTDADVEKICKTVVAPAPPKDEFVTQVDADEPEEILNT